MHAAVYEAVRRRQIELIVAPLVEAALDGRCTECDARVCPGCGHHHGEYLQEGKPCGNSFIAAYMTCRLAVAAFNREPTREPRAVGGNRGSFEMQTYKGPAKASPAPVAKASLKARAVKRVAAARKKVASLEKRVADLEAKLSSLGTRPMVTEAVGDKAAVSRQLADARAELEAARQELRAAEAELEEVAAVEEAVRSALVEHLPGKHDQDKHASGGGGGGEKGPLGQPIGSNGVEGAVAPRPDPDLPRGEEFRADPQNLGTLHFRPAKNLGGLSEEQLLGEITGAMNEMHMRVSGKDASRPDPDHATLSSGGEVDARDFTASRHSAAGVSQVLRPGLHELVDYATKASIGYTRLDSPTKSGKYAGYANRKTYHARTLELSKSWGEAFTGRSKSFLKDPDSPVTKDNIDRVSAHGMAQRLAARRFAAALAFGGLEEAVVTEHLSGKHDQSKHGKGGDGATFGKIVDSKPLGQGISRGRKVTFEDGSMGVWKKEPPDGWDRDSKFADEMSHMAAVRAYEIDQALGLGVVPKAGIVDDPQLGRGVVTEWKEGYVARGRSPSGDLTKPGEREIAVLDHVMEQVDRHDGNWMEDSLTGGRAWAIDNDLAGSYAESMYGMSIPSLAPPPSKRPFELGMARLRDRPKDDPARQAMQDFIRQLPDSLTVHSPGGINGDAFKAATERRYAELKRDWS